MKVDNGVVGTGPVILNYGTRWTWAVHTVPSVLLLGNAPLVLFE